MPSLLNTLLILQESQRKPIHELHKVEDIQYTDTLHSYSNLRFAPSKWDWRDEGAVSPVKNQGTLADSEAIVAAGKYLFLFNRA